MATATAAPPPWLTTAHPEILPVDQAGHTLWPGSRQSWCPSSPIFREHALELVGQMALRYGVHPAVRLWHVSNELGCHNGRCWCDVSAAAFRRWLADRYGDIEKLNDAWGTTFWSQHYATFDEVLPPRITPAVPNPTQQLDFARFSSDALLDYHRAERDVLRQHSTVPVTTNFMISEHQSEQDYFALGAGHGRRQPGPLPRPPAAAPARRAGVRRRPHPRRRGRLVAAHGVGDVGGELAAGERREAARRAARWTRCATSRAEPTASGSSSGGRRGRAARSTTPRSCRTPGRTRRGSAKWWRSARR